MAGPGSNGAEALILVRVNLGILVGILGVASLAGCLGGQGLGRDSSEAPAVPIDRSLAAMEGSIVDQNFIPIPGATVTIHGQDESATSDAHGRFQFVNLQAGTVGIDVSAIGWRDSTTDVTLVTGRVTKVTVFLDPFVAPEMYYELRRVSGKIDCAVVEAASQSTGDVTCGKVKYTLGLPTDWSATVTEVTWGPGGASSAKEGHLWLGYTDKSGAAHTYQSVVSNSPAKMILEPNQTYAALGGNTQTPAAGVSGPLDVTIEKNPTVLIDNIVKAAATFQQDYEIYYSMFYYAAPSDLEHFTAVPT